MKSRTFPLAPSPGRTFLGFLGKHRQALGIAFFICWAAVPAGVWLTAGCAEAAQREVPEQDEIPPEIDAPDEPVPGAARLQFINKLRDEALAQVGAALSGVKSPDRKELAQALGVELNPPRAESRDPDHDALEEIGDLDGDRIPEFVFEWSQGFAESPEPRAPGAGLPAWALILLAWDGSAWRSSSLTEGDGPYSLHVLPKLGTGPAMVITAGLELVPYPVIFRMQDHAASLAWDSRDDESRYQGYVYGEVEFRDAAGGGPPVMIVTGKADPGVIVFHRASRRGFLATGVYMWDGHAFVPQKIAYTPNEDYTLYRFISALHLRDFRSAYAVIDPPKFLKTSSPSVDLFRKHVENAWLEFLGNSIFEARDSEGGPATDYSFELQRGDKLYIYQPTFSKDSKFLLTDLERREEQ